MKIVVEFVRAEQHWSPDSGDQQNFLVFRFAGMEHRIPCEEEDVVAAVKAARGPAEVPAPGIDAHAAALGRVNDDAGAMAGLVDATLSALGAEQELEREFGGDQPVVNPPVLFEAMDEPTPDPTQNAEHIRRGMIAEGMGNRPRTRDKIKQEKLERMRAVAQTAPQVRVTKDDMGYPVVPQRDSAPRVGSAGAPTVVRREVENRSDDDPFGQG